MTPWDSYTSLAQMLGGTRLEENISLVTAQNGWGEVLGLSSEQMVSTQLYWSLHQHPLWTQIEVDVREYLQQIFELNRERNQQLKQEARELIKALNGNGICPMLLKGTGFLFSSHCPDTGYRMQIDIDLLCLEKDVQESTSIIRAMGYGFAEETSDGLELVKAGRAKRLHRIYRYHQHLPPLMNPEKRVLVELHKHAYSTQIQKQFPLVDLFNRARQRSEDGLTWYDMSTEDQLSLLLKQNYVRAGFKASLRLPLRLGRDYLDILDLTRLQTGTQSRNRDEQFAMGLIQALFRPAGSGEYRKYLSWMKRSMNNPTLARFINLYAGLPRKTMNLVHNPWLIWRWF